MTASPTRKAARTLRWTPNADEFGHTAGALAITDRGETTTYIVAEFPAGQPGCRAFQLTKVVGGGGYGVFLCARGPKGDTCECPAGLYRGREACRHRAALRKLVESGRV